MKQRPVLIRPPHASDQTAWRRLWAAYLDFYEAVVPPEASERTWSRLLDPASAMFGRIAVVDGSAAGFLICIVHEGTWSTKPTCYLEDLFVDPAARGKGVGRVLIDDLVGLAGQGGWSSLYWHTRANNARARKLYDRYVRADDFVRYRLTFPSTPTGQLTPSD